MISVTFTIGQSECNIYLKRICRYILNFLQFKLKWLRECGGLKEYQYRPVLLLHSFISSFEKKKNLDILLTEERECVASGSGVCKTTASAALNE